MSFVSPNAAKVVKTQYLYKLKAYGQVFFSLVFIQLLAILFSLYGVGQMGSGSGDIEIKVQYYSADLVVVFTFLWGFITATLITGKGYRYDDFTFITTRLIGNLSNALFLLTASILGSITAMLSAFLIKWIMVLVKGPIYIQQDIQSLTFVEFLIGVAITAFYIFLFCSIGYFVGTLIQLSKLFAFFLPVLFFGLLFLGGIDGAVVKIVYSFIFTESSIVVFIFKVFIVISLFFSSSFFLSNRLEVKQ